MATASSANPYTHVLTPTMPRSEKTKEGFNDQLKAKKAEFDALKGKMEALYSSCSQVMDKDLTTEQQKDIANFLQAADTLSTDFNGSLKPMKLSLESWSQ